MESVNRGVDKPLRRNCGDPVSVHPSCSQSSRFSSLSACPLYLPFDDFEQSDNLDKESFDSHRYFRPGFRCHKSQKCREPREYELELLHIIK